MYAIIEDSGHQIRVQEGDQIDVDLRDTEPGATLTFDKVVLVGGGDTTLIGKPHVEGATVAAEVVALTKGEKVDIVKYKKRKKYRRHTGHRQKYVTVRITSINAG